MALGVAQAGSMTLLRVRVRRRFLLVMGLLAVASLHAADTGREGRESITVFAAASMTNVLQDLAPAFTKETGVAVTLSFGASSALARQIEAGAQVDAFISADEAWMDYLAARKLIMPASRRDIAGNALVLIAPADSHVSLAIAPGFPLRAALGDGRLAVADPDTVPAGRYAKAALTQLGVWDSVKSRLANADNVRAALAFVARGEAPLGIVYATDARIEKHVQVVGVFPAATHAPITYPAAVPAGGKPGGAAFLGFLGSPAGAAVFARYGFTRVARTSR
ncbi:MAG: Molybdate-binding protein ModA [Steroidobacteraceae bacterium]|nr:Molybdate-binding protein ModA [Steroidobacteraceae bacterium]